MFAQLGSIPFQGLQGFTEFSETRSTNIAEHARIEGKPRLQRVGSNLHDLKLSILLHASFCNPEQQFSALDEARENAELLPLVLSNGVYVSDYVLASLDRTVQQTDPQSNIISMTLSLSLKEAYNPNPQQRLSVAAKQAAYAVGDGGATPMRLVRNLPPTDAQQAMFDIVDTRTNGVDVNGQVQRAALYEDERPYRSGKIVSSLNKIDASCRDLRDKLTDPRINPFAGGLPSATASVQSAVYNLLAALPISDMDEVLALNDALMGAIDSMKGAAGPLNNIIITRNL